MSTRVENSLRRLAQLAALATMAIGVVTLAGWAFDLPQLRSFLPGAIGIRPFASVCALLLGTSLLLVTREWKSGGPRRLAQGGVLLVGVLAAVTLLEYILGWDTGLGGVLFPRAVKQFGAYGGRMAPIAAFEFLLIAAALWLLSGRKSWGGRAGQGAALVAAVASLLSLVGYTFRLEVLYTLNLWTGQGLPSALACFLLALGALLACPERGWVRALASEHAGGRLLRLALPVIVGLTWLTSWLSVVGARAGFYSDKVDQVFVAVPLMLVFCIVLVLTAQKLNRAGEQQEAQRREVERMTQDLEARVEQRTAQLAETVTALGQEAEERREAEEQLRKQAELLELAPVAVLVRDQESRITYWSRGAEALYGWSRQEALGQVTHQLLQTKFPMPLQEIEATMLEQRVWEGELVHTTRSGGTITVFSRQALQRNPAGEPSGFLEVNADISERKQAEQRVRRASRYTRSLIEASLDPLLTINKDGKIMDVNRAMEQVTGVAREKLIGSDFSAYFTEPDKARLGYELVFAQGSVQHYPLAIRHTSGQISEVLYNATVFRNEAGEVEGVFAAARDISARKRAEAAVQAERQRLFDVLNVMPAYVILLTPDYHVTFINRIFRELFGEPRDRPCYEYLFGRNQPCEHCESFETLKTGSVHTWEWTGPDRRTYQIIDSPFVEADGSTVVLEMGLDVTERKRAEEQVRRAALYTRNLIEASLDPLVTISKDGKIMDVNRATEQVTGVAREKLIGSDFCEYFTEPDKARQGYQLVFAQGFVQDYPLALRHVSGRVTEVLYNATVFKNEAGEVEGVFAAARDITERRHAEEQVRALNLELEDRVRRRTAELEASNHELESFTYSVSHDLRAPLRHVDAFSKILLEEYGLQLDENGRHYLERVRQGTQFMGHLVDDLLNLSRLGRQELAIQITGLGKLVEEARQELAAELEGREVEWCIGDLPFTECDPGLMKQVLVNLLSNALKFTRTRPRAVIEVGQQPSDGAPVIFVRDNGVGFNMKYAQKLFGIFQRLHRQEDFEGTGVGLATVQRILHKHGGRIWAEAELDKGATFYFTLGPAEASGSRPADRQEAAA